MADTQDNKKDGAADALYDVDELAAELGVDAAALAGIKCRAGWHKGKMVSKKQFETVRKQFLNGSC